jgi:hypothetical protein
MVQAFSIGISVPSTSGIQFTSITTTASPDTYIFSSLGASSFSSNMPLATAGVAQDNLKNISPGSVTIAGSGTAGLASISYTVASNASAGPVSVSFTSASVTAVDTNGLFTPSQLNTVPGTITVTPEPAVFAMLVPAAAAWLLMRRHQRVS